MILGASQPESAGVLNPSRTSMSLEWSRLAVNAYTFTVVEYSVDVLPITSETVSGLFPENSRNSSESAHGGEQGGKRTSHWRLRRSSVPGSRPHLRPRLLPRLISREVEGEMVSAGRRIRSRDHSCRGQRKARGIGYHPGRSTSPQSKRRSTARPSRSSSNCETRTIPVPATVRLATRGAIRPRSSITKPPCISELWWPS